MDFLKKFWPHAFALEKKVVKPFVIQLIIYVVVGTVVSLLTSVINYLVALAGLDVLTLIVAAVLALVSSVVGLYCTAGIVFSILKFTGVFKD